MKKAWRAGAFFLACVLALSSLTLISCSGSGVAQTTAVSTVPEGPDDSSPVFPEADYNGDEFTVYIAEGGNYVANYIDGEENDADVVSAEAWVRNSRVEDRYNVAFSWRYALNPSLTLKTDISSGACGYDMLIDRRNMMATGCTSGLLMDWNRLNVDYSTKWWDERCIEDLTIHGKAYLMMNDICTARFEGIRFFYFNKRIAEDYHITSPYVYLEKNEWTLDNFLNSVKAVKTTQEGESTEFGVYGLLLEVDTNNSLPIHMLTGCGITYSGVDTDGNVYCNLGEKLDSMDLILSKLRTAFLDKTSVITYAQAVERDTRQISGDSSVGMYPRGRTLFKLGKFLFAHCSVAAASFIADGMEDDFGCVPNPKIDSSQKEYRHLCDPLTVIFGIPNDSTVDTERLAVITDYWSYVSNGTVVPKYYDITIKSKKVTEETASKTIDIVRDTVRYEVLGSFGITFPANIINAAFNTGSISSEYNKYAVILINSIKKLNSQFDN